MRSWTIGHSFWEIPIKAFEFKSTGPKILILGGIHGDEREGIICAHLLLAYFEKQPSLRHSVTLVPTLNMDGLISQQRTNGNQVDLNRNLPTRDWSPVVENPRYHPGAFAGSEPENQALLKLIEQGHFDFVLSLHSWKPLLNTNGDCLAVANEISRCNGYPVEPTVGYPTPGCLGTYAGLERAIPTLTYEFEKGLAPLKIKELHCPAIISGLNQLR